MSDKMQIFRVAMLVDGLDKESIQQLLSDAIQAGLTAIREGNLNRPDRPAFDLQNRNVSFGITNIGEAEGLSIIPKSIKLF